MSHWQLWFAQHALDYSGGERHKCHATTLIDHMCTSVYNSHDYKLYISTLRNTLIKLLLLVHLNNNIMFNELP